MDDRSKVLKFGGFRWDGIPVREYKTGDVPYRDVTRQTLLGEGAGEEPFNFVTRYFEIQPGGYSTLEDRKSTRLNSSHLVISYAVFCLKKKKTIRRINTTLTTSPSA